MRELTPRLTRARARGAAVRRLLVSGVVATTVVAVTTATLAGPGGAVHPLAGAPPLESGAGASATDRALSVPAISVSQAWVKRSKGTKKLPPSAVDDLDIPATAILAYQHAVLVIGRVDASCGLSWTLLAAIGRVESDHGRFGNAWLRPDGTSSPAIRGVALDGTGPVARIRDTDGGRLDGDSVWDRAVGPMQFLPSTWSVVAVDADADSVRSPDDLDDAALAAAVFLCGAPGDLSTRSGLRAAVHRYNPSRSYVTSVLAVERSYRDGDFGTPGQVVRFDSVDIVAVRSDPTSSAPAGDRLRGRSDDEPATGAGSGTEPRRQREQGAATRPQTGPGSGSADAPGVDPNGVLDPPATPDPGPADPPSTDPTGTPATDPPATPDPTGTPDPSATPDPTGTPDPSGTPGSTPTPGSSPPPPPEPEPGPVHLTGILSACGAGWCLDGLALDAGGPDFLAATSSADFSGDGVLGSHSDELTALAGTEVSVSVAPDTAPALLLALNGLSYTG